MPITQREADIMQADAELKVERMFNEWMTNFMQGRLPTPEEIVAVAEEQGIPATEQPQDPSQGVPAPPQEGQVSLTPEAQDGPY